MIDIARVRELARMPKPRPKSVPLSRPQPQSKEPPKVSTVIQVKGVKINTLIPPACLVGMVPPEPEPAGNPVLDIELEGSVVVLRAVLNGKSVRKACKAIAKHGVDGVNVCLQANLKAGTAIAAPMILDSAGLSVTPKGRPAEPAPEGAGGAS